MSLSNELHDLLDIVEHLIHTHPTWNLGLSQVAAQEKLKRVRDAVNAAEPYIDTTKRVVDDVAQVADAVVQPPFPDPAVGVPGSSVTTAVFSEGGTNG